MSYRGILRSRNGNYRWPWADKQGEVQTTGDAETPVVSHQDEKGAAPLSARDEKEAVERPDEVNLDAKPGLQKAEAVALIWSKKTIVGLLCWYVLIIFCICYKYLLSTFHISTYRSM